MSFLREELQQLTVDTEFKLKYHGPHLDKCICHNTTVKHNQLIDFIDRLITRIEVLERAVKNLQKEDK